LQVTPHAALFVHDVGFNLQHFGLPALTLQYSTSVGGVDTPHESSDMKTQGKQYSYVVEADIAASPGKHEQTNMSFSFCFSHNKNNSLNQTHFESSPLHHPP
jgi:hypothetical protein